jgi:predicted nucleic-acid-binding protein
MARRGIIDANVVLRYLLNDDPKQSPEAVELFEGAPGGSLYLSVIILAEVTWTLTSHFAVPRDEICASIQRVLALPSVSVDPVAFDAVARYAKTNVDFTDCALAAAGAVSGLPLVTYDKDFRKFGDVIARRPGEMLGELGKSGEQ